MAFPCKLGRSETGEWCIRCRREGERSVQIVCGEECWRTTPDERRALLDTPPFPATDTQCRRSLARQVGFLVCDPQGRGARMIGRDRQPAEGQGASPPKLRASNLTAHAARLFQSLRAERHGLRAFHVRKPTAIVDAGRVDRLSSENCSSQRVAKPPAGAGMPRSPQGRSGRQP